jgi:hypothetical protein
MFLARRTASLSVLMFISWSSEHSILQNHLIDNLSTKDASPAPKLLLIAIEFFINHIAAAATTLHMNLLSDSVSSCTPIFPFSKY